MVFVVYLHFKHELTLNFVCGGGGQNKTSINYFILYIFNQVFPSKLQFFKSYQFFEYSAWIDIQCIKYLSLFTINIQALLYLIETKIIQLIASVDGLYF